MVQPIRVVAGNELSFIEMTEAEPDQKLILRAAELLKAGELVAFPTETVYGLGADASSKAAISKLYTAKGRPSSHPVIVHLHSVEQISGWAVDVPDLVYRLADSFWPGPMTVILKRSKTVIDSVTGGQDTVGLRIPNHPVALALLREFGGGVVAPSANKFGRLSPTSAQHVRDEFGDELAMVLDGGACQVGIESTIIDLTQESWRILRPGMISERQIAFVADPPGEKSYSAASTELSSMEVMAEVRVPGSLASHYAPSTKMILVASDTLSDFIDARRSEGQNISVVSFKPVASGFSSKNWITLADTPELFAREIYSSLRICDSNKSDLIVVELPSLDSFDFLQKADWAGVIDRLRRAAF